MMFDDPADPLTPLLGVLTAVLVALSLHCAPRQRDIHCAARAYDFLESTDTVTLAGERLTVDSIANRYQPELSIREEAGDDAPILSWYELVPSSEQIYLTYYLAWRDEDHPNAPVDRAYDQFRQMHYGSRRDIEYVMVVVETETGAIAAIRYESSRNENFDKHVTEHLTTDIVVIAADSQVATFHSETGSEIGRFQVATIPRRQDHIQLTVQTWNHLLRLRARSDSTHRILPAPPLRWLSDEDYEYYRFCRRSAPEYDLLRSPSRRE